jgi:hypothetical protein
MRGRFGLRLINRQPEVFAALTKIADLSEIETSVDHVRGDEEDVARRLVRYIVAGAGFGVGSTARYEDDDALSGFYAAELRACPCGLCGAEGGCGCVVLHAWVVWLHFCVGEDVLWESAVHVLF